MKKVSESQKGNSKNEAVSQVRSSKRSLHPILEEKTKAAPESKEQPAPESEARPNTIDECEADFLQDSTFTKAEVHRAAHICWLARNSGYPIDWLFEMGAEIIHDKRPSSRRQPLAREALFLALDKLELIAIRAGGLLSILGHKHESLIRKYEAGKFSNMEAGALNFFAADMAEALTEQYNVVLKLAGSLS